MFGAAGLVIIAKLIGLVSQIALASKLGVSAISDAYFLVLLVPTLLCNVLGGAVGLATVGSIVNPSRIRNANAILLLKSFLFVAPVLVLLTLFRSQIAQLFITEVDAPAKIVAFSKLSLVFWPLTCFMCVSQIALVWQNAIGKLMLPALSPLSYAMVLLAMVGFDLFDSVEELLINAQMLGVFLELAIVLLSAWRQGLLQFDKQSFVSAWPNVVLLKTSVVQNAFSWFILSLSAPIEQYFSSLQGPGVNTLIGFTGRIVIPLCAILGSALTLVALKFLLEIHGLGATKKYWRRCLNAAFLVYLAGTVVSFALSFFSDLLIGFIYRGPSFAANDIVLIGHLFSLLVYLLPAQLVIMFSYRVFSISGHGRYQLYLVLGSLFVLVCGIHLLPALRPGENIVLSSLIANHLLAVAYLFLAFEFMRRARGP